MTRTPNIWDIEQQMQQLAKHALPGEAARRARALLTQLDTDEAKRRPGAMDRILEAYAEVIRRAEGVEA